MVLLTLQTYLLLPVLSIYLSYSDFTIPRFRTVAYSEHSLTYLDPFFGPHSTNLFDRLNNWTL